MRILVADDGALFRAGLASLLRAGGHTVVGEARDGFEALEQARLLEPDVILLDVDMPRCSGVQATRLIKAEVPRARVILLTDSSETGALIEAVTQGIDGYVVKDMPASALTHAIEELVVDEVTPRPHPTDPRRASTSVAP